jgi:hypothetical protein
MSALTQHNLDIQSYSFEELLDLFNLTPNMTSTEMLRAKKQVLQLHPDKSRLPSQYYIFYKQAFEVVVDYYKNMTKSEQVIPTEKQAYIPMVHDNNAEVMTSIHEQMKNMGISSFNTKLNELYDTHVAKKVDESRYNWFKQDEPSFAVEKGVSVNSGIDRFREQQNRLIRYQGVQNYNVATFGNSYFDDEEDPNQYVSCDPFSKLKFDDVRRVHRDQTVLPVSERDFDASKQYKNVDELNKARSSGFTMMQKTEAEKMLEEQYKRDTKSFLTKQHQDRLQSMQYDQKQKDVLSNFLLLK